MTTTDDDGQAMVTGRARERTAFMAKAGVPEWPVTPWSHLIHPLTLAIATHRCPDGTWTRDPFADEETGISFPTLRWVQGLCAVDGLGMPRSDRPQMPGEGGDNSDDMAYWLTTSIGSSETTIVFAGLFPETMMMAMKGMPLHEVIGLPPIEDVDVLARCRSLVIDDVQIVDGLCLIMLSPIGWMPAGPVPAHLASLRPEMTFLDMPHES